MHRLFYDDNKDGGILSTLASVIKHFTLRYQPKWHAADVAETIHLTLRMLHRLSNAGEYAETLSRVTPLIGGRKDVEDNLG